MNELDLMDKSKNDYHYKKVDEGSRNQNLFSHLCKMIRTIKDKQELFSQAVMYNNTYFSKPLSEDEVRNTVNSVISYINQDGLKMDEYGIYKTIVKKDEDGNDQYVKKHITDFVITDAQIVRNIDTEEQVMVGIYDFCKQHKFKPKKKRLKNLMNISR